MCVSSGDYSIMGTGLYDAFVGLCATRGIPHPRPGEPLEAYHGRVADYYQRIVNAAPDDVPVIVNEYDDANERERELYYGPRWAVAV